MTRRALVLEGGGMRSAYVAGALMALYQCGPRDFDLVVGTSAGACCAANFLVGRPEYNQYVLEEHLASYRFIDYRRIFSKKNVMDVDFLIDECFETLQPLKKILENSPTKFLITATNCITGKAIFLDAKKESLPEALRASCAMPYLYRRQLYYQGDRVMDGSLSTSIPIHRAIEEGCDEIYVVCSRPKNYRKKPSKSDWIHNLTFRKYPEVAKSLQKRGENYNSEINLIENPPPGVKIIAIRPEHELPVHRATRDKIKIRQGIQQGFYDGFQVLKKSPPPPAKEGLDEGNRQFKR